MDEIILLASKKVQNQHYSARSDSFIRQRRVKFTARHNHKENKTRVSKLMRRNATTIRCYIRSQQISKLSERINETKKMADRDVLYLQQGIVRTKNLLHN